MPSHPADRESADRVDGLRIEPRSGGADDLRLEKTAETASSAGLGVSSAPPWMVFWLLTTLILLPSRAGTYWTSLKDLVGVGPVQISAPASQALRLANVLDLMPLVVIAVAVLTAVLAPLRGRRIERRYQLSAETPGAALAEIRAFVQACAPGVVVHTRATRTDLTAFAYVRGYRRPALAVFGGLALLWRKDRAAAEATIRHELAHVRQGDSLLMGAVSSFEDTLRNWPLMWVVFGAFPVMVTSVAGALDLLGHVGAAGLGHTAHQLLTLTLPHTALSLVTATLTVLPVLVLPIAASWSAELAADHAAGVGPATLLAAGERRRRGLTWLLTHITHPPLRWRHRLAASGRRRALAAVLIYPAAMMLQPIWIVLGLASLYAQDAVIERYDQGTGALHDFGPTLSHNLAGWASERWPLWLAAVVTAAAWPLVAGYWPRLFAPAVSAPSGLRPHVPPVHEGVAPDRSGRGRAAGIAGLVIFLLVVDILGGYMISQSRKAHRQAAAAAVEPTGITSSSAVVVPEPSAVPEPSVVPGSSVVPEPTLVPESTVALQAGELPGVLEVVDVASVQMLGGSSLDENQVGEWLRRGVFRFDDVGGFTYRDGRSAKTVVGQCVDHGSWWQASGTSMDTPPQAIMNRAVTAQLRRIGDRYRITLTDTLAVSVVVPGSSRVAGTTTAYQAVVEAAAP